MMSLREKWKEGCEEFNRRRYWESHECWEQGWRDLPSPQKEDLQSLIQAAAVFYHLERGRVGPALSLAAAALLKRSRIQEELGGSERARPRVEIPGIEEVLESILRTPESQLLSSEWRSWAAGLNAVLIL